MAELNEINNQTDLDYFFDSYYSTRVSRYNTDFELPEDCKNMSFSELFDQELFSTQENKDCKITIKIEKEDPLDSYNTVDDIQDTFNSCISVNTEENICSLPKSYTPKKGINRTFIKNTDNCNVTNLIPNPFCETDDLNIYQTSLNVNTPIIKQEPEDDIFDQIFSGTKFTQCSVDNSQNTIDSLDLVKVEDNIVSKLSKSSTPKRRGINRSFITNTNNCDVNYPLYEPFCKTEDLKIGKTLLNFNTPIIKQEPEDDIIDQINFVSKPTLCSVDNSQNTIDSLSLKKVEDNSLSKQRKILGINKSFIKNTPIIKQEPEDDIIDQINFGSKPTLCSVDNTQNTIDSLSLKKVEDNSLSKQRKVLGINKSFIKNNNNCDVNYPLYEPFCKTEDLKIGQTSLNVKTPVIKQEPQDGIMDQDILKKKFADFPCTVKQKIIKPEQIPCYSFDNSQNIVNNNSYQGIEDNILSSLSKSSIQKHQGVFNMPVNNTENCDVKDLIYNPLSEKNVGIDQMTLKGNIPILKLKPKSTIDKDFGIQTITYYTGDGSQNTTNCLSLVNIKNNSSAKISKNILPKQKEINKTAFKTNKTYTKLLIKKPIYKTETLGVNRTLVKVKTPIQYVSRGVNDNNKPQNTNVGQSFVKIEDDILFLSSKSSPKRENRTYIKTTENCDKKKMYKQNLKSENSVIDQLSVKVKTSTDQNISGDKKPCHGDNLPNMATSHRFVKIEDGFLAALSKSSISERRDIKKSTKTTNNYNKQLTEKSMCNLKNLRNDQTLVKVETPIMTSENVGVDVEEIIVGMDEIHEKKSVYIGSNAICCDLNNKNQEVTTIKEENILCNESSLKNNNTNSQICSFETDKKKITWEEFRAKREKMGLLNIAGNIEESPKDQVTIDKSKLESIIKEFDQNTAEYFIGQKRKTEDTDKQNPTIKKICKADLELQNKRMKIEYIKKLIPSSFASEIAKTSLMKGISSEYMENESTSDDLIISNNKIETKYANINENLRNLKKDDKYQKKGHVTRDYSSNYTLSKFDFNNRNSRSSSILSNPDQFYNHNRIDITQGGQYGKNVRNTVQRSKDQKRVVYVGQIPIRLGKRYLQSRFKEFGTILSLTLHKKPDFRVYYAFVTYSDKSEAERAISQGNNDKTQVQLDIRFGERKQTQTPYYDLDDEWLTDWYGYKQPMTAMRSKPYDERVSFKEELEEFNKLNQINKLNQKPSHVS